MSPRRLGLTLIEVIATVAVVALLLGLLIPAVRSSRESSRRAACRDNVRQVAAAILNSESQKGRLPDLYNGTFLPQPRSALDEFHFHSWRTAILPQLEQAAVFNALNLAQPITTASNVTAFSTRLAVFVCPSTSNVNDAVPDISEWNDGAVPVRMVGAAARSDYEVIGGVRARPQTAASSDLSIIDFGPWGEPSYDVASGASLRYRVARLADVADGLSNTVLISERSGRPDIYARGKPAYPYPYGNPMDSPDHHQGAWAISTHFWWLVSQAGQPVNLKNRAGGFYSFHPAGAHAALADGAVRFLGDAISPKILDAISTRAGAEVAAWAQ